MFIVNTPQAQLTTQNIKYASDTQHAPYDQLDSNNAIFAMSFQNEAFGRGPPVFTLAWLPIKTKKKWLTPSKVTSQV